MRQGYAVHAQERMSFLKEEEGEDVISVRVCMSVHPGQPTNASVTHHIAPCGCDCSRSDLYVRVSACTFVHTHTGTTCTSA